MKKTILLVVMILTLTIIIVGCWTVKEPLNISTSANNEPPDISVFINNREIKYVCAKNKWKDSFP
jgi:predicted small lipoprotein YifL